MEWEYRLEGIRAAAERCWKSLEGKTVIAFHGELGAGKTSFIHALCDYLRVGDAVSSPTFSIINEYAAPGGKIYHIDLYRLEGEEEARRAGVEDCLYSGATCLVEWPERAPGLFPGDTVHLYFDVLSQDRRRIRKVG